MGRGGQRVAAGRPGWHVKAEHCLRIEASRWSREGVLEDGRAGEWVWRNTETREETGRISYWVTGGAIALSFSSGGVPVHQLIRKVHTPCHFGGSRVWFGCPRCQKRVGVLFYRGKAGFICRHCGKVAYSSQSEDDIGRGWIKQAKLEKRLGPHWQRPKGMHRATHSLLVGRILACEEARELGLTNFLDALRLRYPHLRDDPLLA